MIDSPVRDRLEINIQPQQRDDYRDERKRIQSEAPRRAGILQRQAAEHRPDHARQIELNRIQRDGVRQIFLFDKARDQRRVSRTAERLRGPDHE